MSNEQPAELVLNVSLDGADTEELDALTRQLLVEILDQPVESAALVTESAAPEGTKAGEAITFGAILVSVLPSFLPKLVEFLQAWSLRGQGRTIKFKGKVGGNDFEFEGAAEDLKALLAALQGNAGAGSQASAT